ncbi:MAG: NAD(P)/FAD-dependent oxidoreductase [Pseudomonadales bacterium]|nr:NAD(P)/FAD-dependent oxidoreductase [Pseudomonadales bacterium]MBO6700880.1 NAD(P)/FAD-dependent oxidoreductase [Pseudomonadales bacterium]MBO7007821.1 NAD(P)/FAD-dependent oxidoreductase [Pseudomonadales bacterium]
MKKYDVIVIGAGVCGIYMLYRLLKQGLNVLVLDKADGPGGTWYWNRYPGARFDSESYTYGYSFSEELLQEWDWSEHFAAQPETLRYLNHVVDKFDLREPMRFGAHVQSAKFDDASNEWHVVLEDGDIFSSTFLCTAIGMLSAATPPRIEGIDRFQGQAFHTYDWPQEPVDLKGQRVGVVGTGATGVQVIGAIADEVGELTVFQRRPNWCAPLHNSKISAEDMADIKARYDEIFAQCAATPNGFLHGPDRRELKEVPEAEKYAFWEDLYNSPGFGVWLGNFRDVLTDMDANAEFSNFIANKIRERVNDPAIAEKLIPKDHGFGTRRVPMETRYYEAYNLDHVSLVDINETPIECIDETGIQTTETRHEFDVLIFATGFDAITGAFDRIHIEGTGGQKLSDKWHDGPMTYLGMQVAGFPNLFTLAGPQGASVATNFPPAIETCVDWASDFIEHLFKEGVTRVEAKQSAEDAWVEHVKSFYDMSLVSNTQSWFTGYNSNVDGHDKLRYMIYLGGSPTYREKLADVASSGYKGFTTS